MVIVWGGIAYQIVGGLDGDDTDFQTPDFDQPIQHVQKDSFQYELSLAYDDPFQSSRRRGISRNTTVVRESGVPRTNNLNGRKKKPNIIQWPQIKYGGIVKSSNQKKVGLLSINGSSYLAKEGDIFQEVLVKKYTEEEMVLKYNGEEKTIKK